MSKPSSPDSPWRGCAANFEMPLTKEETEAAQKLVDTVHRVNCVDRNPLWLESHTEEVMVMTVTSSAPCSVGTRGLIMRSFKVASKHIRDQAIPAPTICTTLSKTLRGNLMIQICVEGMPSLAPLLVEVNWHPQPSVDTLPGGGDEMQVYRYEIYAPGGIWVRLTLGGEHTDTSQAQVCFVGGIAPHYIRCAQLFTFTRPTYNPANQPVPQVTYKRADDNLIINGHFNPLLNEDENLRIQSPIFCYGDGDRVQGFLSFETYTPTTRRQKRQVSSDKWEATVKWYGHDVGDVPSYINAAFRSSWNKGAYLFMKNECVLMMNYAKATTNDRTRIVPFLICDGFPWLIDTPFGEHGIDCAFDTDDNEAFIFSAILCAYIDYAPIFTIADQIHGNQILSGSGPVTITDMFPFFKGTVFEDGIDAAFRSSKNKEAYLFRGGQYALIHYDSKRLIHILNINDGFPSLLGTVFESGIDAAFASHNKHEAYLFKGAYYALINFAPHSTYDYIIGGRIKRILDLWPSFRSILPCKNHGLDVHTHCPENHVQLHGCMII